MKRKPNTGAGLRLTLIAAALVAATALAACGGGGSGNTVVDKPGVALHTSAPNIVTIPNGQSATFDVIGGGAGSQFVSYKASSSNSQVATVKLDGSKLTITAGLGGTAVINVTDNAGAVVAINVTVPTTTAGNLAISAPANVTLGPGMTAKYNVAGGTPPYTAVASNPAVAAVIANDGVVSVTAANPGSSAVVVYDQKGDGVKFDLLVSGGSSNIALYTTAPSDVVLGNNATATYQIAGGQPPYTVTSNNTDIADASLNGNALTVKSKTTAGKATINIRDAQGVLITFSASVNGTPAVPLFTTAPALISLGVGSSLSYSIQGGTGPYTATASRASVIKATVDGSNLNVTGLTSGTSEIVVFDSTGATAKITAVVGGGSTNVPLYTTAPDSITVATGASPTYTIAGGAAPYVVVSSDVKVITVSTTGSTFTATGVAPGTASITVRDANGTPVTITVLVK